MKAGSLPIATDGVGASFCRALRTAHAPTFRQVLLVVVFCQVVVPGRFELHHDLLSRHPLGPGSSVQLCLHLRHHPLRLSFLLGAVVVNAAAVLGAGVVALAVQGRGVGALEEDIKQLAVGNFLGVVVHLDGFSVTGAPGAHLLVGGIGGLALGIPHGGVGHARDALVCELDAPEATSGKGGDVLALRSGGRGQFGAGLGVASHLKDVVVLALKQERRGRVRGWGSQGWGAAGPEIGKELTSSSFWRMDSPHASPSRLQTGCQKSSWERLRTERHA